MQLELAPTEAEDAAARFDEGYGGADDSKHLKAFCWVISLERAMYPLHTKAASELLHLPAPSLPPRHKPVNAGWSAVHQLSEKQVVHDRETLQKAQKLGGLACRGVYKLAPHEATDDH